MASFRRGAEAIQAAATRSGGGGKFTPTHRFEAGEVKYLQFLTSIEDIPTVLMHRFIIVGTKENGDPKYSEFISRRDSGLDGPEGYDELIDRFESHPAQKCIALAVELVPVYDTKGGKKVLAGFDLATREYTNSDDEEVEVPNVALIIESPFTFFGHLTAFADIKPIEDVVFAVKRTGKKTDTQYTFIEAGEALDLEDEIGDFFETFDFEEYLEDLADEDRMREALKDLPDDFVVNRYAKKNKKKADAKAESKTAAKSTRTRRVKAEEPVEEEPEEEAEAAAPARTRRFSQLRSEMAS